MFFPLFLRAKRVANILYCDFLPRFYNFCTKHFGICIYEMNESKQPYSFDSEGFDMLEVHVLKN